MAERDSFVFYRSFHECIRELPPKSACALYMAVCEYALNQSEPELKGLEAGIFAMIKPQIDANNKRYENGKKGGRPKEANKNQKETTGYKNDGRINNQTETKEKPNDNVNVNDNVNDITPISPLERFEYFYTCYPLDKNKSAAERAYCDVVTNGIYGEDELVDAAKNYAEYCKLTGMDKIYHASNFLSKAAFEDYLPGRYKKPETKKKSGFNNIEQNNYNFVELEKKLLRMQ